MREFIKGWQGKAGCAVLVMACILLYWCISINVTRVEVGENVPTVPWLPNSASNVSFYKSYSYTAYEFDIPETAFVNWSRWGLTPITQPVQVWRYCLFQVANVPQPDPSASDEELKAFSDLRNSGMATITDGLFYERRQRNGGGVRVAYDRNRGRAFYQSAPR